MLGNFGDDCCGRILDGRFGGVGGEQISRRHQREVECCGRQNRRESNKGERVMSKEVKSKRTIDNPRVVSREEWITARKELLAKEKNLTRQRDAVSAERRQLPGGKVDKEYVFDSPGGEKNLADLFEGRGPCILDYF